MGSTGRSNFRGCKRIFYGNAFRTFVFAEFQEFGSGSRISLRFGMSTFTTIFLTLWFAMAALIGGAMTIYAVTAYFRGEAQPETWVFIAGPLTIAGFGIGIVKFGRWLGRNESGFLAAFLQTKLEATEAPASHRG